MIQSYGTYRTCSTYSQTTNMVSHMHKKAGHPVCKVMHCDTPYCKCFLFSNEVLLYYVPLPRIQHLIPHTLMIFRTAANVTTSSRHHIHHLHRTIKLHLQYVLHIGLWRVVEMWNSPKNERYSYSYSMQRGNPSVETVATTPSRVFQLFYSGGQQRHHPAKTRPTDSSTATVPTLGPLAKTAPWGKSLIGVSMVVFLFFACQRRCLHHHTWPVVFSCDNYSTQSTALCKANLYTCVHKFHYRLSPALVKLDVKSSGENKNESQMLPYQNLRRTVLL